MGLVEHALNNFSRVEQMVNTAETRPKRGASKATAVERAFVAQFLGVRL